MAKARSVLVLLVALMLGLCLAVPAEDVPETAYDESDSLPFQGTLPFSVEIPNPFVEVLGLKAPISLLRSASLRLGAYHSGHTTSSPFPISVSLTIVDQTFRC